MLCIPYNVVNNTCVFCNIVKNRKKIAMFISNGRHMNDKRFKVHVFLTTLYIISDIFATFWARHVKRCPDKNVAETVCIIDNVVKYTKEPARFETDN